MRGQKSRSSPGVRRGFEGGQMPLYRRIPKLRGIAGACFRGCETVSVRQLRDALLMDKRRMERCFLAVEIFLGLGSATSENTQKKFLDVKRFSLQVRESLEELKSKGDKSRLALMGVLIELEKERFDKKRMEEELDIARRKVLRLQAQKEGSSVVDELRQELREYKEIVKCNTCLDPPKEVVITKFYHLLCNPCVQRITESRHRKCLVCAASFGPNDVIPVYI